VRSHTLYLAGVADRTQSSQPNSVEQPCASPQAVPPAVSSLPLWIVAIVSLLFALAAILVGLWRLWQERLVSRTIEEVCKGFIDGRRISPIRVDELLRLGGHEGASLVLQDRTTAEYRAMSHRILEVLEHPQSPLQAALAALTEAISRSNRQTAALDVRLRAIEDRLARMDRGRQPDIPPPGDAGTPAGTGPHRRTSRTGRGRVPCGSRGTVQLPLDTNGGGSTGGLRWQLFVPGARRRS